MDIKEKIEGVLKKLRSNLQVNEADLQLLSYDENLSLALIDMRGLAQNTTHQESMGVLKYGIMEVVMSSVPEVKEVRVV